MPLGEIIIGSLMVCFAGAAAMDAWFTSRGKGPVFSTVYIFASKEERKQLDIKEEYRVMTIVFSCIAAIFSLLAINIFTHWRWPYILMWIVIFSVCIYAVKDSIRITHRDLNK